MPITRQCEADRNFRYSHSAPQRDTRHIRLPRYTPDSPRFIRHRTQLESFKKKLQERRRERLESIMARLGDTAERGDVRAFVNAVREVAWERSSAEDAARAISLAFRAGAPTAAEHIYDAATRCRPDSPELQRFARLFAPARQITRTLPANPTLRANREWLKSHRTEYRGQWVALRNGELLATATSLNELTRRVGDTANVLLTRA